MSGINQPNDKTGVVIKLPEAPKKQPSNAFLAALAAVRRIGKGK